jgi:hypothetical protein
MVMRMGSFQGLVCSEKVEFIASCGRTSNGNYIENVISVVFDASRRIRKEHCLNDFMLPGPLLQGDLSLVLVH